MKTYQYVKIYQFDKFIGKKTFIIMINEKKIITDVKIEFHYVREHFLD